MLNVAQAEAIEKAAVTLLQRNVTAPFNLTLLNLGAATSNAKEAWSMSLSTDHVITKSASSIVSPHVQVQRTLVCQQHRAASSARNHHSLLLQTRLQPSCRLRKQMQVISSVLRAGHHRMHSCGGTDLLTCFILTTLQLHVQSKSAGVRLMLQQPPGVTTPLCRQAWHSASGQSELCERATMARMQLYLTAWLGSTGSPAQQSYAQNSIRLSSVVWAFTVRHLEATMEQMVAQWQTTAAAANVRKAVPAPMSGMTSSSRSAKKTHAGSRRVPEPLQKQALFRRAVSVWMTYSGRQPAARWRSL